MANQLQVATVHSILTLRERGWSQRRLARTLGTHRETVARYLQLDHAGCGPPEDDPKPAKPAHGSGPRSQCEPYRVPVSGGSGEGRVIVQA